MVNKVVYNNKLEAYLTVADCSMAVMTRFSRNDGGKRAVESLPVQSRRPVTAVVYTALHRQVVHVGRQETFCMVR